MKWRKNRDTKRSPLHDFYFGSQAAIFDMDLITRDVKRYRTYFPTVRLISPEMMQAFNIEQRDEYQKLIYAQVTSYDPDVWFPNGVLAANVRGDSLIKTWREYCKLTKAELADKAGMKQSSLARLEKSATSPGKSTSTKLVKAMGIGIEQLID